MKRYLALILVCLMLVMLFVGCQSPSTNSSTTSSSTTSSSTTSSDSSSSSTTPTKVFEMKIGTTTAVGHPITIAAQDIASKINERSGGRIAATVYPAEQLGAEMAQVENMQAGLQQALLSSVENFGNYVPDFNITGLAFAFKDADHVRAWFESDLGKTAFQKAKDDWGLVCVEYDFQRLPRQIVSKTPVYEPADLVGRKFRIANIPIWKYNWLTLGATPVVTSFAELPMALIQGIVDSTEGALEDIYSNKLYETAPYITMVNYGFPMQMFTCSAIFWDSLDEELQTIIKESAHEAGQTFAKKLREEWEEHKKEMIAAGTKFLEVDRTPWEDAIKPLVKKLEDEKFWDTPGLYDKVQNLVK